MKTDNSLVMVTGASGFIGKSLVDFLERKKVRVRPCVRDVNSFHHSSKYVFETGDISKRTDWSEALHGVSEVIHTAARVHLIKDLSPDPLSDFRRVNVSATVRLARQAAQAGVRRFIFLSTVKVVGESSSFGRPLKASDPSKPSDPYAISKAEAESELLKIASETDLEVVIIRPPLVYGSGVKANFSLLVNAIKMRLPLPFGLITQNRRSMVSLQNLVDFIFLCLKAPKAKNQIFMISDGEDVSTADLTMRIAKSLGFKSYLIPIPIPVLQNLAFIFGLKSSMARLSGSLQVDINKNFKLLNWKPKTTLDVGLRLALSEDVEDGA